MSDPKAGAILQRDKTTYAIKPRTPLGVIDPDTLERIARVVREYDIPAVKITSAQRLMLLGIREEDLGPIKEALGPVGELCKNYVQACPGTDWCSFGMTDAMGMGARLDSMIFGRNFPAKVKIGVSGCNFNCGESRYRDVGLIGTPRGWTVLVGGNGGKRPRLADVLAKGLSDDEAEKLVGAFLDLYAAEASVRHRTSLYVQKCGIEAIREKLGAPATE
ncbi:NAD(P)/FAD-dependent oxidoreductase [Oceanidesulfovibrio indonesiensis]|uniref:NAD(P)/FAD-dependent oxidoreductase n=1 Tax=Oceanidesulfovibrio indonesiensis TaxID=54767 RepID=A0A7M3MCS7_9BACT|nr:NAD(P)/FAD-dependent oxidoreductase [Oceanidesulfovibrio indonesiensis]TVM16240.1 NAD(P)/FAD-dependent oxidoreductase [Oceanidesulfovibrio indonesiensis]